MSIRRWILVLIVSFIAAVVGYFVYLNYLFMYRPLVTMRNLAYDTALSVKVYPRTHLHQLSNQLELQQLWIHPHIFVFLARLHGFSGHLRYGEYQVTPLMTADELLQNIEASRGLVKHNIRIREGITTADVLDALSKDSNIVSQKISPQKLLDDAKFNVLNGGKPLAKKTLEGLIYPDTYRFAWGTPLKSVVQYGLNRMLGLMQQQWAKRAKGLPITTPYQALIVASLIETEAGNVAERPMVAGVIYNRIKKKMRLQVDTTVMYGLKLPYGSILTKKQLATKTRYNTYKIKGLPPTPIALPTKSAILAALHPAKTKALFYVADGKGSHVFSGNYKQHKVAVKRYRAYMKGRQWQREKEGVKAIIEEML